MNTLLLDTNVLIRSFYPSTDDYEALHFALSEMIPVVWSEVSLAEMLVKATPKEQKMLYELELVSAPKPITRQVLIKAANLRRKTLKQKKVFLQDCYITATALLEEATLVTNNTSDFKVFVNYGLRITTPSGIIANSNH